MAFRTTIRNQGDLVTENIAGSSSEFIIQTDKFINSQTQNVASFAELRAISTKSQIVNVVGVGAFERVAYTGQTDNNSTTIVVTDLSYTYVKSSTNLSNTPLYNYCNTSSLGVLVGSGSTNYWSINLAANVSPVLNANEFTVLGFRSVMYDKSNFADCGSYDVTMQIFRSAASGTLQIIGTPAEDTRFISGSGLTHATPTVSGTTVKFNAGSNIHTGSISAYAWWNSGVLFS